MRHARRLVRLALVLLVAAGGVVAGFTPAEAVQVHRPLNDTRAVGAAPVSVGFPIDYFGLVADLPGGTAHLPEAGPAPYGEVRFRVAGHWTAWQALDQDGAQAAGTFTAALVDAHRADAYQVRGLPAAAHNPRAAAINTTEGPLVTVGHRAAGAAATTTCMSRADWGADESISGWAHGETPVYYPDQVITVHHTAGSNDLNQDYSATVRAIYSYHVQTNGWSDIGYQYLLDGHGVVYEGRWSGHTSKSCLSQGGDGSDFAHQTTTDYVVTGAHVAGWNSGNLGIALMGCYDNGNGCTGSTTPPAAAVDSLEHLLAALSTRHGLDPQGSTSYVNPVNGSAKTVATVSGHRDWEATACPGGNLYAELPTIRATAAALMGSGSTPPPAPDFSLSLSPSSATVSAGRSTSATVSVTDTGSTQTVALTATGAPSGVSITFSPTSVTGSASSTMAVAVSSTTTAASYSITVSGSNGSVTRSATYTLTVSAAKGGGKKR